MRVATVHRLIVSLGPVVCIGGRHVVNRLMVAYRQLGFMVWVHNVLHRCVHDRLRVGNMRMLDVV